MTGYAASRARIVLFAIVPSLLTGLRPSPARAQNPPAAAEFEVATVKPQPQSIDLQPGMVAPPGYDFRLSMQDRAQDGLLDTRPRGWIPMDKAFVTIKRWTLANLIAAAYRVPRDRISGPSWITELRFDVNAKIPDGAPAASVNGMLQSLLKERFGLTTHSEDRELQGYALTVAKGGPKLTAAEARPEATNPDFAPSTPRPMSDEQKTNMMRQMQSTMAAMAAARADAPPGATGGSSSAHYELKAATAADIASRIGQFIKKQVADLTGLEGKYDLDLEILQGPGDSPEYAASQAVARFGLKLNAQKVPTQMIVVDSASKTPAGN